MPQFSGRSLRRLETCEAALLYLFQKVIRQVDCTIIEGHRNEGRQYELFELVDK